MNRRWNIDIIIMYDQIEHKFIERVEIMQIVLLIILKYIRRYY